jgi:hypothetical protein
MSPNDTSKALFGCVGALCYTALLIVVNAAMSGWVLSCLWRWFIVTGFAAPPLSVARAAGIALIASFIVRHPVNIKTETQKSQAQAVAEGILQVIFAPLFALSIGYVVAQFL